MCTFQIITHEIGHNLGMEHDHHESHDESPECDQSYNIMSYSNSGRTQWSECSKKDFQAHFIEFENDWCLDSKF